MPGTAVGAVMPSVLRSEGEGSAAAPERSHLGATGGTWLARLHASLRWWRGGGPAGAGAAAGVRAAGAAPGRPAAGQGRRRAAGLVGVEGLADRERAHRHRG